MKLTDLKPCECCAGPVAPFIHEVTVRRIFIKPDAVNRTLGLNQMLGGDALGLAEVFSPDGSVTEELDSHTALLCSECAMETLAKVMRDED